MELCTHEKAVFSSCEYIHGVVHLNSCAKFDTNPINYGQLFSFKMLIFCQGNRVNCYLKVVCTCIVKVTKL